MSMFAIVVPAVVCLLTPPKVSLKAPDVADAVFQLRVLASAGRVAVRDPALLARSLARSRSRSQRKATGAARIPPRVEGAATKQITFTGCGGLYTYLFGVAAYIQQNFEWDTSSTVFASASAGCYPAFLLASGIDVEAFHHGPNRKFLASVDALPPLDPRASALGTWNDAIREHIIPAIEERLTDAQLASVLHRKHYLSFTVLPSLENQLVGEFESLADLVDGFIASGYIPIYDRRGRLGASYRGQRIIDGGISDNAPQPFGASVPSLVLAPSKWREHPDVSARVPVPFVRSDWAWCHEKYLLGKADAAAHHAELAEYFSS